MALAQCERFFSAHPEWKRVPAEDTAGSVREALSRGDKSCAAIAGRRAAEHYHGVILAESNPGQRREFHALRAPASGIRSRVVGFSRRSQSLPGHAPCSSPGALLASLEPSRKHGVNLLKIESRPIHGRPWEYQFFIDVEASDVARLDQALNEVSSATSELASSAATPRHPASRQAENHF